MGQVKTPPPGARPGVAPPPVLARIVGAVDAAQSRRIDDGVEPMRIAGRDGDAHPSEPLLSRREALRELAPRCATVRGFVKAAAWPLPGAVFPGALPRRPEVGIDRLR